MIDSSLVVLDVVAPLFPFLDLLITSVKASEDSHVVTSVEALSLFLLIAIEGEAVAVVAGGNVPEHIVGASGTTVLFVCPTLSATGFSLETCTLSNSILVTVLIPLAAIFSEVFNWKELAVPRGACAILGGNRTGVFNPGLGRNFGNGGNELWSPLIDFLIGLGIMESGRSTCNFHEINQTEII